MEDQGRHNEVETTQQTDNVKTDNRRDDQESSVLWTRRFGEQTAPYPSAPTFSNSSESSQNLVGVCPPVAIPTGSFATMYRDTRYKISVYHGHNRGELYDLETDPWEFDNLWDDPKHQSLKCDLLLKNFDAAMLTGIDVGSRRIAPM